MLRLIGLFILFSHATLFAAKYELDTAHSRMEFRIKHMLISTVTGRFKSFTGTGDFDLESMKVDNAKVVIDVDSIDTNEPDRDKHLRSPDFFDAAKYPKITFEILNVIYEGKGTDRVAKKIVGKLTIKDHTKEITLNVKSSGAAVDPWGNESLGFDATTTINRNDFGLTWNKKALNPLKKVAVWLVGDDVELDISVEARKVKEKSKDAKVPTEKK